MSAAGETPTRAKGKRHRQNNSTKNPTPRRVKPAPARNKNGENDETGGDSSKKLNIFHYFGGGGSAAAAPRTPVTSKQPSKAAARAGSGGSGVVKRRRSGPTAVVEEADAAASAPSWGKLVDPRSQRRWDLLKRLQDGGGGGEVGADPTAWARRSYCLSYAPVFNDCRPPGMGSTSEWGWGCQSQVFGGTRACLRQGPDREANNHAPDGCSTSDRSSVGVHEPTTGIEGEDEAEDEEEVQAAKAEAVEFGAAAWSNSGRRRRGRRRGQDLQSKNFRTMVTWLSSSDSSSRSTASGKTFLEIALERRDGGPAAAFMTLMSLAPEALLAEEEAESAAADDDAAASHHDPVALLLRLYHAGGTWRRVSKEPPARRRGRGSRLHPNDAGLAAAVDEADDRARYRRSAADHAAALVLLGAGLVDSLDAAAGGGGAFSRGGAADRGGSSSGGSGSSGTVRDAPDPLVALALAEALTAAELRSLTKALGINTGVGGAADGGGKGGQGRQGSGGGGRSSGAVDVKDEVCRALERWLIRPENAAKRKSRLSRAARGAAELVSTVGRQESGGGGGSGRGGGSEVLVIRLADDAREAVQRVHAAFFAAARHGPHDVCAVLREDLDRVMFGGGDAGPEEAKTGRGLLQGSRPPPAVLSSVEAFAEFFRLVSLADGLEMAARAGDSGLAYGFLHEASTVLLPSGCPLCRDHVVSQRGREGSNARDGAVAAPRLPHCDVCELSAKVVMRGVGLMERDKDYSNAFHYLEILLQAASQRLSVRRPQYWLRLVTDLGHKKRALEALQACEKALAEACPNPRSKNTAASSTPPPPPPSEDSGRERQQPRSPPEASSNREPPGESSTPAAGAGGVGAGEEEAAILPLGEALPLIRRAVRLAVPPLRWRKRPPPELRGAALRVMSLDLSWRRAGKREREGPGDEAAAGADEGGSGEWIEGEAGEAMGSAGEAGADGGGSAGGVAPGTSLEQAVLDALLAELGPGWKGLHSENSVCLGLFALLCWDALFAPLVPAAPVGSAAPADTPGRSRSSPPAGNLAAEPSRPAAFAAVAKRPPDQHPPPQDPKDSVPAVAWRGDGEPTAPRAAEAQQPEEENLPVAAVAGTAQGLAPGPSSAGAGADATNEEIAMARSGRGCRGEARIGEAFYPFPSPFQSEPADLMTPFFAGRRRRLLEGVYAGVERGGAGAMIRRTWSRHHGKACTGLNWGLFQEGVEGWVAVASAIGPLPLLCVCRNLASNYWAWRHGLPDLFLWRDNVKVAPDNAQLCSAAAAAAAAASGNSPLVADSTGATAAQVASTAQTVVAKAASTPASVGGGGWAEAPEAPKKEGGCKWVEVKGPGDSLSCAQEAWIDALVRAGADFVLLRVEDAAGLPK
eukprot:g11299.t1